jgi:hypothetical protein
MSSQCLRLVPCLCGLLAPSTLARSRAFRGLSDALDAWHATFPERRSAGAMPIARVSKHLGISKVATEMACLRLREHDRRNLMAGAWSHELF